MSMAFRRLAESEGFSDEDLQMYARDHARLECRDDRTNQADKDSTDIKLIVARTLQTGIAPMTRQVPQFGDISDISNLQDALDIVAEAGKFFMGLPSGTREAFGNDPAAFVMESQDPAYRRKFQDLGLTPKDEAAPGGAASSGTGGT